MEPLLWTAFFVIIAGLLAFDLGILHRKPRALGVRDALTLSAIYFVLAMLFGAGVFIFKSPQAGYEFITGYLVEYSLSMDNIFVFVLIFSYFKVPPQYQHRVLLWGILGALALRGLLIGLGAALIATFHWIIYLFGAFLIFTGIKMLLAAESKPNLEDNRIIHFIKSRFRVTESFKEDRFFVRHDGKLWMTPLFMVLILVEISDLIFAVDSIPAIFAVTSDVFVIFTSNVFAILGLRSLYFALAAIIHRFEYLKFGLSAVLVIIGGKMIVNAWFDAKVISTELALGITIGILFFSVILSLYKTRGRPAAPPPEMTGWIPGSDTDGTHRE